MKKREKLMKLIKVRLIVIVLASALKGGGIFASVGDIFAGEVD